MGNIPNPFHYVIAPRTDAERLEVEAWLLADQLINVLNDGQPKAFQRRDQMCFVAPPARSRFNKTLGQGRAPTPHETVF